VRLYRGRFRSTEITFGPRGRVVVTLALLLPLYWFLQAGPLGVVGLVVWVGGILPRALRDVWRDVPEASRVRAEREHLMAPRPDKDDDVPVSERQAPPRW
jgi:hypothetical protein